MLRSDTAHIIWQTPKWIPYHGTRKSKYCNRKTLLPKRRRRAKHLFIYFCSDGGQVADDVLYRKILMRCTIDGCSNRSNRAKRKAVF